MLQYGRDLSSHVCFVRKKWCCFYILLKGIVNHLYASFHFGVNDRIPWICWFLWFFFTVLWSENLYITLESKNLLRDENPCIVSLFSPVSHPSFYPFIHSCIRSSYYISCTSNYPVDTLVSFLVPLGRALYLYSWNRP